MCRCQLEVVFQRFQFCSLFNNQTFIKLGAWAIYIPLLAWYKHLLETCRGLNTLSLVNAKICFNRSPWGKKRFLFYLWRTDNIRESTNISQGKQKLLWSKLAHWDISLSLHSAWDPQLPTKYNPGFTVAGDKSKCPHPAFSIFDQVIWKLNCDNTKGHVSYGAKVVISTILPDLGSQRPYPSPWACTGVYNPNRLNGQAAPKGV